MMSGTPRPPHLSGPTIASSGACQQCHRTPPAVRGSILCLRCSIVIKKLESTPFRKWRSKPQFHHASIEDLLSAARAGRGCYICSRFAQWASTQIRAHPGPEAAWKGEIVVGPMGRDGRVGRANIALFVSWKFVDGTSGQMKTSANFENKTFPIVRSRARK